MSYPEVCTSLEYEEPAVSGPVGIDAICDQLLGSAAFSRNQPEITGRVSLRRIRSGENRVENVVPFRRPSRAASRLRATRELRGLAPIERLNPYLRDSINIIDESDSVAVRGKARLPVSAWKS